MATKLTNIRKTLNITQEKLARKADIPFSTYRRAETGLNVSYTTATSILTAINQLRADKQLEPLDLGDLGLIIV